MFHSYNKAVSVFLRHIAVRTSPRPGTDESRCSAEGHHHAISDTTDADLCFMSGRLLSSDFC